MATYGDKGSEYPYTRQKEEKKKYAVITKVIDFAQLPVTTGDINKSGYSTTAWAAGDILQAINIKPDTHVLGVQVEILSRSFDAGDSIDVGYGSDTDKWGRYDLSSKAELKTVKSDGAQIPDYFFEPIYFSTRDTIDIIINKAVIQGKIKLYVYTLQNDRI